MCGTWRWVQANWHRLIGLPTPDAGVWMLRDTPISLSTLKQLKSRSLVERAGRKRVESTLTKKETEQMTYRTKRHDGVFEKIEEYASGSRSTAEAFAARQEADLYVVEMLASGRSVVARDADHVRDMFDLDVQVIGVGVKEPDEYPGEFVEVPRAELVDVSSKVWRMVPDEPDLLTVQVPHTHPLTVEMFESSTSGHPQYMTPCPRRLSNWVKLFLIGMEENGDENERDESQSGLARFAARSTSTSEEAGVPSGPTIGGMGRGQTSLTEF